MPSDSVSPVIALVVPTCRESSLREFLAAWLPVRWWDELVIVQDGPEASFDVPAGAHHASWAEIEADLGSDAAIISRRDSAIRAYGFLVAHRLRADLVVTLDDDCMPVPGVDYLAGHRRALEASPRWSELIPGLRTRGYPYRELGRRDVAANIGLWRGVPDLDAPTSLAAGCPSDFEPPAYDRILAPGPFPWCGMNFAVRGSYLPLMYYPPQGDGAPYRRFDDIWMGLLAKRVIDHLGAAVSVGRPIVEHRRASDQLVNLVKEAPGIAANERLWGAIDAIPLEGDAPAACMAEAGRWLASSEDSYLRLWGANVLKWVGLFTH